jgi:ACT domain-containing protein
VISVEGPSDIPVIEQFLLKLDLYGKYSIKLWPLGGDNMEQVDLSLFAQNHKIIALIDRDDGSAKARKRFEAKCDEAGIAVHRLKRYAIENYFTVRALKAVFKGQLDDSIKEINPAIKLQKQIGIDVKKNNHRITKEMQLSEIENTDLMQFFDKLKSMLESGDRLASRRPA